MSRVVFFYFNGTDPFILKIFSAVGKALNQPSLGLLTVPGLDRTAAWVDGSISNDPFTALLDPNIFEAYHVSYPAFGIGITPSINAGVDKLVKLINALPAGQKYAVGGYSQGAAVAGRAYAQIKSGALGTKAANDFIGGVCFGSPIRQAGYRGEVGGTWSGSWDTASNTGSHGCFPANGPVPRLTDCDPTKWIEFAEYDDVITSVGDSSNGVGWVGGANAIVNLLTGNPFATAAAVWSAVTVYWDAIGAAFNVAGKSLPYVDATGRAFEFPGNGHVAYPWRPPPGYPDGNLTSYQIAIKWLTSKALQYATAPILMQSSPSGNSSTTAGWTTSLTAP